MEENPYLSPKNNRTETPSEESLYESTLAGLKQNQGLSPSLGVLAISACNIALTIIAACFIIWTDSEVAASATLGALIGLVALGNNFILILMALYWFRKLRVWAFLVVFFRLQLG